MFKPLNTIRPLGIPFKYEFNGTYYDVSVTVSNDYLSKTAPVISSNTTKVGPVT